MSFRQWIYKIIIFCLLACKSTHAMDLLKSATSALDVQLVKSALDTKVDPNTCNIKLLHELAGRDQFSEYELTHESKLKIYDIAFLLIKAGACVNARDVQNKTPHDIAFYNNQIKLASLFIESGVIIDASPITYAESCCSSIFFIFDEEQDELKREVLETLVLTASYQDLQPLFLLQCIFRISTEENLKVTIPRDLRRLILTIVQRMVYESKCKIAQEALGALQPHQYMQLKQSIDRVRRNVISYKAIVLPILKQQG